MSDRWKMSQVSRMVFMSMGSFRGCRGSGGRFVAQRAAGLEEEDVVEAGPVEGDRRRLQPGTVEDAEEQRHGRLATVDVEPDDAVLAGRLADERLAPDGLEDVLGRAVDAERDDVAGDLALELVGRALGDDLARGR